MGVVRFFAKHRFNHVDTASLMACGFLVGSGDVKAAAILFVASIFASVLIEALARVSA